MVPDDVFADEVVIDWPATGVVNRWVAKTGCGEVVSESVEPDVRHVALIPWKWDTPIEARSAH